MDRDEDRREGQRFSIQQDVQYRAAIGRKLVAGRGHTVNASSSGVLFTGDSPLPEDVWVTVEINWPVRLEYRKPIKLVIHGKVVRCVDGMIAVRIRDYEFRTVSAAGASGMEAPEPGAGHGSAAHG